MSFRIIINHSALGGKQISLSIYIVTPREWLTLWINSGWGSVRNPAARPRSRVENPETTRSGSHSPVAPPRGWGAHLTWPTYRSQALCTERPLCLLRGSGPVDPGSSRVVPRSASTSQHHSRTGKQTCHTGVDTYTKSLEWPVKIVGEMAPWR